MKFDSRKPDPATQGPAESRPAATGKDAAFTMVEIALCLGVIAIALVAIIGVLPTGVRVQKDNREDTIINQEGLLWLETIRSGSKGLDYLTNYVDSITVTNVGPGGKTVTIHTNSPGLFRAGNPTIDGSMTNGHEIVSLLTLPKYFTNQVPGITNYVTARVRAISGSASDKSRSAAARDFAFAYQLTSERVQMNVHPPYSTNYLETGLPQADVLTRSNLWRMALNQSANFEELRLTLQGPLIPRGGSYEVLGTPATFRTLISGTVLATNGIFVEPSAFVQR
ncbi:MAG TPA: hypothetical protein VN887_19005 [Candidatus Angelobacter sp.]|nr:hypothetical protein [Candidatus Angelobacter sp.]